MHLHIFHAYKKLEQFEVPWHLCIPQIELLKKGEGGTKEDLAYFLPDALKRIS